MDSCVREEPEYSILPSGSSISIMGRVIIWALRMPGKCFLVAYHSTPLMKLQSCGVLVEPNMTSRRRLCWGCECALFDTLYSEFFIHETTSSGVTISFSVEGAILFASSFCQLSSFERTQASMNQILYPEMMSNE